MVFFWYIIRLMDRLETSYSFTYYISRFFGGGISSSTETEKEKAAREVSKMIEVRTQRLAEKICIDCI